MEDSPSQKEIQELFDTALNKEQRQELRDDWQKSGTNQSFLPWVTDKLAKGSAEGSESSPEQATESLSSSSASSAQNTSEESEKKQADRDTWTYFLDLFNVQESVASKSSGIDEPEGVEGVKDLAKVTSTAPVEGEPKTEEPLVGKVENVLGSGTGLSDWSKPTTEGVAESSEAREGSLSQTVQPESGIEHRESTPPKSGSLEPEVTPSPKPAESSEFLSAKVEEVLGSETAPFNQPREEVPTSSSSEGTEKKTETPPPGKVTTAPSPKPADLSESLSAKVEEVLGSENVFPDRSGPSWIESTSEVPIPPSSGSADKWTFSHSWGIPLDEKVRKSLESPGDPFSDWNSSENIEEHAEKSLPLPSGGGSSPPGGGGGGGSSPPGGGGGGGSSPPGGGGGGGSSPPGGGGGGGSSPPGGSGGGGSSPPGGSGGGGGWDDEVRKSLEEFAKKLSELDKPLDKFKDMLVEMTKEKEKEKKEKEEKGKESIMDWLSKLSPQSFFTASLGVGGESGSGAGRAASTFLKKTGPMAQKGLGMMGKALRASGSASGGAIGSAIGGAAGGALAGLGAVLGPVAAFGGALAASVDIIKKWDQAALESAFKFAEVSGSMAAVKAQMEMRDIQQAQAHGEAQSASAGKLAEAVSAMNAEWAPLEDMFANISNNILAALTEMIRELGVAVKWIVTIGGIVEEWWNKDKPSDTDYQEWIDRMDAASRWWERHGRFNRPRQRPRGLNE